ncbi:hypothetical protein GCM10023191_082030 [Actinoallomurus oryzae]|uniref:Uncharacterized protein n=1 Tax=Actinoallomurus oryzae TaxID=502180 RepID=A0ABP8QZF2_9ACTN
MTSENIENAPRFPEGCTVLAWYPPLGAEERDRSAWAWLPGSIVSRCGEDEWCVVVEAADLAEPDPNIPHGDAPENLLYPLCFRDSSELRAVSAEEWSRARGEEAW